MFMGMLFVQPSLYPLSSCKGTLQACIYISAWASALLILERRQCEGQVCGISDTYRSRAFLYMASGMSGCNYICTEHHRHKLFIKNRPVRELRTYYNKVYII